MRLKPRRMRTPRLPFTEGSPVPGAGITVEGGSIAEF
jgi:hypothetical protein